MIKIDKNTQFIIDLQSKDNIDTLWSLRMNRDTYWIDENISNPKYINRMNP